MKIQLTSAEILKAVRQYVNTLGIDLTGKAVQIEFIQRQKVGLTADVIIDEPVITDTSGHIEETPDAPINDHADEESIDGSQSIFG